MFRGSACSASGVQLPRLRVQARECCLLHRAPGLRGRDGSVCFPYGDIVCPCLRGHLPPASHCPFAVSCWSKPQPASSLFISLLVVAPGRTQESVSISPDLKPLSPLTLGSSQSRVSSLAHSVCVWRGHCARKASGYSDVSAGPGSDPLTPFVRAPHFMDLSLMGLHRIFQVCHFVGSQSMKGHS